MSYRSLARRGESHLVVQKSKFLGIAAPVTSEEEAVALLNEIRADNPTSSAIAYAYIIGENIQRFSDGGEPSGTAGMPILSVMQKKGLTRCLCAVVRWFGGIKLGAGGLARAFSGCGTDAMENAGYALWCPTADYAVRVAYGDLGKIEYQLASCPWERLDTQFTDQVTLVMRARVEDAKGMLDRFYEWTAGDMIAEPVGAAYDYPWEISDPSESY